MISRNVLTPIALVLGLGFLPASAQATPEAPAAKDVHRPNRPGPMGRGEGMAKLEERFAIAVHLTDAQKASIKEIRSKHQATLEPRMKAAQEARKAFAEAARKPETSLADLKALHQAAADKTFDLRMDHRAQRLEIRALLSPEQREQAAKFEGRLEGMAMSRNGGNRRWGQRGQGASFRAEK